MKNILVLIVYFAFTLNAASQENSLPQSFQSLRLFDLGKIEWSDTHENPKVYYVPSQTELIDQSINEGNDFYTEHSEMFASRLVMKTKLNKSDAEHIAIIYDDGPSGDPNFSFYKIVGDSNEYIGSIGALVLFIPGNGNLYASGHANNLFNTRKKYTLNHGELKEVRQPYYYVGLKTTTKELISLYESKDLKKKVATLPKLSEVEILLNEGDYFLLRSSFGLVGWWKLDDYYSKAFPELFFNGD